MPTADAVVETERAARYLERLCRHAHQMRRMPGYRPRRHDGDHVPPTIRHVEWSEARGDIDVDGARCTLRADGKALTLHLEAADDETLRRVQALVTGRLQTIGRRDNLTVTWTSPDGHGAGAAVSAGTGYPGGGPRAVLLLVAVVATALAAHLAIGDAALEESPSLRWTAVIVVIAILIKLAIVVLGRSMMGHRLSPHGRSRPSSRD